jgi:hypothetical protein
MSSMVDSASDPEQLKTEDPNRHVVDYLRYYCDPGNSFDFAVMLKGPWGAAKTYLIKNFLDERSHNVSEKKTCTSACTGQLRFNRSRTVSIGNCIRFFRREPGCS